MQGKKNPRKFINWKCVLLKLFGSLLVSHLCQPEKRLEVATLSQQVKNWTTEKDQQLFLDPSKK